MSTNITCYTWIVNFTLWAVEWANIGVLGQLLHSDQRAFHTYHLKKFDPKDESEKAFSKLVINGTIQISQLPSSKDCITVVHGDRKGEKMGYVMFNKKKGLTQFHPIKWLNSDDETKSRSNP